jgi:hypothetical protein
LIHASGRVEGITRGNSLDLTALKGCDSKDRNNWLLGAR